MILDLYNYLPSTSGKKIIANFLEGRRNQRCNKNGSSSLESLELFSSINPLDQTIEDNIFYCQTKYPNAEFIPADCDNYDEDEWVTEDSFEERNIFEVLDDEILHQNNVKYNLCLIVVVLYIWLKNA